MTLDEIFTKNLTDKNSKEHNYTPYYEKHLPKEINNFIEIGCWRGAGIKSFKEWYNGKGTFYAMDRFLEGHGLITPEELQAIGINSYRGDQKDMWFISSIRETFTVCIDDSSHHWLDQIITFKIFFHKNIEPGGWYIIEDVFDEPYWGQGIILDHRDNIKGALTKWKTEGTLTGLLFSEEDNKLLAPLIEEVHIYGNIIFIKKKL